MLATANIRLETLTCNVADEGVDEPYLWAFYVTVDGLHVKQDPNNLTRLASSITVVTPSGSTGNLGTTMQAGQQVAIPPSIGSFSTTLKPIALSGLGQSIAIPGSVAAFVALIESDGIPAYAAEAAHQAVRQFVEQEFNAYLNALDLSQLLSKVVAQYGPQPTPEQVYAYLRDNELTALQNKIKAGIPTVVMSAVLSAVGSNVVDLVAAIGDPDNALGDGLFMDSEVGLFQAYPAKPIKMTFTSADSPANYVLQGQCQVAFNLQQPELQRTLNLIASMAGEPVPCTIQDQDCLPQPLSTTWRLVRHEEAAELLWLHPFGTVRWWINGTAITEDVDASAGTLLVPASVWIPTFDGSAPVEFTAYSYSMKTVSVRYEMSRRNQFPVLTLFNQPDDGNFDLTVDLDMVDLPNGSVLGIDQVLVSFDGLSIEIPPDVRQALEECHQRLRARQAILRRGATRFHQARPPELWGPYQRQRWLDIQSTKLIAMSAAGKLTDEVARQAIAQARVALALSEQAIRTSEWAGGALSAALPPCGCRG